MKELLYLDADLKRYGAASFGSKVRLLLSKPQARVIFYYRLARHFKSKGSLAAKTFFPFFRLLHRWACQSISCELPISCEIGPGLKIYHGYCLVINANVVIGSNFTVQHGVTVGSTRKGVPRFGDDVEVGANATVIGDLFVGNNAMVGAGAVITKDVPSNAVVVGNPQRVIKSVISPV